MNSKMNLRNVAAIVACLAAGKKEAPTHSPHRGKRFLRGFARNVAVFGMAAVMCMVLFACPKDDDNKNDDNGTTVTLESMKKAARDAGYEVDNSYLNIWGDNVVGGFTVVFVTGNVDAHIPVLQYKDKASADAVAKREKDAGYNYPIQNGKFLTFTTARNGEATNRTEKTFLENLINGKSL